MTTMEFAIILFGIGGFLFTTVYSNHNERLAQQYIREHRTYKGRPLDNDLIDMLCAQDDADRADRAAIAEIYGAW